jgi:serine/threonine protein kinase
VAEVAYNVPQSLEAGVVLSGKYRIDQVIGRGGMGVVARATQVDLERGVAIKVLRSEVRSQPEVIERFYREARASARIRGKHAVQIFEVAKTEDGDPFMVMELLVGEDLDKLIRRAGPQPLDVAVTFMMQACAGVQDAHAAHIVHRDLKPSNLFLARERGTLVLKVLDFGISRVDDEASALTRTSMQLGTPHYMSPEQIHNPRAVDARTDIWALGCIFMKLLTGDPPFKAEGAPQIVVAVLRNMRKKARDRVPSLPAAVDEVIDRCLAPSPADRYQSVAELAGALAALAPGEEHAVLARVLKSQEVRAADVDVGHAATMAMTPHSETPPVRSDEAVHVMSVAPPPQPQAPAPAPAPDGPSLDIPVVEATAVGDSTLRSQQPPPSQSALPVARTRPAFAPRRRRSAVRPLLIVGIAFMAVGAATVVIAPRVIAGRMKDAAARGGVTLAYDAPSFTLGGVRLTNVRASASSAKDATLSAARVKISWTGSEVVMSDVNIASKGSLAELDQTFASHASWLPPRVEADRVRFRIELADGVNVDGDAGTVTAVDGQGRTKWNLASPHAIVHLGPADLGPYAIDVTGMREAITLHAGLDPTHEGANATITFTREPAQVAVNARIPRGALARYGIPPALAEAAGSGTEVELTFDAKLQPDGTVAGNGTAAVYGIAGANDGASRFDVSSYFTLGGRADAVELTSKQATLGPFPASGHGTIWSRSPARTTFSFEALDVSCSELARGKATNQWMANGVKLADLARYPGTLAATGTVQAAFDGTIVAEMPPRADVAFTRASTCGISVFPRAHAAP